MATPSERTEQAIAEIEKALPPHVLDAAGENSGPYFAALMHVAACMMARRMNAAGQGCYDPILETRAMMVFHARLTLELNKGDDECHAKQ
jgi:hypothetical protein